MRPFIVSHHRLSKLDYYGTPVFTTIRGRCKGWIGAFLENRSQVVSVNANTLQEGGVEWSGVA